MAITCEERRPLMKTGDPGVRICLFLQWASQTDAAATCCGPGAVVYILPCVEALVRERVSWHLVPETLVGNMWEFRSAEFLFLGKPWVCLLNEIPGDRQAALQSAPLPTRSLCPPPGSSTPWAGQAARRQADHWPARPLWTWAWTISLSRSWNTHFFWLTLKT